LLTADEWNTLRTQIDRLPRETQRAIELRYEELERSSGPLTCPFLDRNNGECLVYPARPIQCRSYGYYVERDRGLYCGQIQERVERGDFDSVIWGNHESVEAGLESIGPRHPLLEWVRHSRYPQ
jgi:Fe-S-cluster containining protein